MTLPAAAPLKAKNAAADEIEAKVRQKLAVKGGPAPVPPASEDGHAEAAEAPAPALPRRRG